jgi:uncharacterized protein YjiS (DUF1127 family)
MRHTVRAIEWVQIDHFRTHASQRPLSKLLRQIAQRRERARSRYLLQQLDDRMLRDIGLSRADVHRECAKYFWQW